MNCNQPEKANFNNSIDAECWGGDELILLTIPEIRTAETITESRTIQTADGPVIGRKGDVLVNAYDNEYYPVKEEIFYGTYEVLENLSGRMVVKRLLHPRNAWVITDDGTTFNYGGDRGTVIVNKGSWLYQSDENDFGVINNKVNHKSHFILGSREELEKTNWAKKYNFCVSILICLPPLMTLLAVGALVAYLTNKINWLPTVLLSLESLLLVVGVTLHYYFEKNNWHLRAIFTEGFSLSKKFQVLVEILGSKESQSFPTMSLWRAAQSFSDKKLTWPNIEKSDAIKLSAIKQELSKTVSSINQKIIKQKQTKLLLLSASLITALIIFSINIYLITTEHLLPLEVISICLPTMLSALYSYHLINSSSLNIRRVKYFHQQLIHIQKRLLEFTPGNELGKSKCGDELIMLLIFLSKVIAKFNQEQLEAEIAPKTEMPV